MGDNLDRKQLLTVAQEDLAIARDLHRLGHQSNAGVLFHAQQAVEKSLKATLTAHDIPFRPIHDLDRLIRLWEQAGHETPSVLEGAARLTPYATRLRYRSDRPGSVTHTEALDWAAAAVAWAEGA